MRFVLHFVLSGQLLRIGSESGAVGVAEGLMDWFGTGSAAVITQSGVRALPVQVFFTCW
jgi:hypothetical protein